MTFLISRHVQVVDPRHPLNGKIGEVVNILNNDQFNVQFPKAGGGVDAFRFASKQLVLSKDPLTTLTTARPAAPVSTPAGQFGPAGPVGPPGPTGPPGDGGNYLSLSGGTMDTGAVIAFANGSSIQEAGYAGIRFFCSVGFAQDWREGRLFTYDSDGATINRVEHQFYPPSIYDGTEAYFREGSFWHTRSNQLFVCDDPTQDNADWIEITPPSFQLFEDVVISMEQRITALEGGGGGGG
jgi:hypothetical protein